jgi:hypothetical protein
VAQGSEKSKEVRMAFRTAIIVHAPGADPKKHRCSIETPKLVMFAVAVKDQSQAIEECRNLVKNQGVHSIMLCPGFTHRDVAGIADAAGDGASICVARCDGPSSRVAQEVMAREGWFTEHGKA